MNDPVATLSHLKAAFVVIGYVGVVASCMAGTYITYTAVAVDASLFRLTTLQFIRYANRCDDPDRKQVWSRDGDHRCTRE